VRRAALALVVLAAPPASAAADAPKGWRPHVAEARAYALERAGQVSFSVRTEEDFWAFRPDRVVPSASVVKAMFMVAYLNRDGVRDRPLSSKQHELLSAMIRRSDNDAATAIRNILGDAALVRLARRAHMTRFSPAPIWGLSHITARDQTRLFLKIERLIPERHRPTAMTLLRTIVPGQRWGIAPVARRKRLKIFFKGGWVPGITHQVALLQRRRDGKRIAVAVLTRNSPSMAYGEQTIEGVAARLLR
jgi:Beta-lactamase enzyme family